MANRKFTLTEEEVRALQAAYLHEQDGPTRSRYLAVRLYGQKRPLADVLDVAGCCRASLMAWCQKYRAAGLAGLRDRRGGPHAAKLTVPEITALRTKLLEYTPYDVLGPQGPPGSGQHWTVAALYLAVEKWFGVTYRSRTSYLNLFAACDFSYQRTEKVFKSRRERQVLDFEAHTEKK